MKDADLKPEQTVKLLSFANNNLADLHLKCNALRNTYDTSYTYGPNHPNEYYYEACKDMLIEEAERLYKNKAKEEIEKIITDYSTATISQRPEKEAHTFQRQALTNVTRMYAEDSTVVHSEIEDD
jgi:hypothetical protein